MLYETPWTVERPEGARFYHRMTLPEIGEVDGYWDLRDCTDAYLGNYNFQGKRVLDVGAASGFLSFAMEERGAEVVSFDIDDGANWDIVPNFQRDLGTELEVASGLSGDEQVVVNPPDSIAEGQTVRVVTSSPGGPGKAPTR